MNSRLALLLLLSVPLSGCSLGPDTTTPPAAFDRVIETVERDFLFPDRFDADWERARDGARGQIDETTDDATLVAILNRLVKRLGVSHTRVIGVDDPSSADLRGIFSRDLDGFPRPTIGAELERASVAWQVTAVLAGSPAATAGLLVGDRVTTIDGGLAHPVRSLRGKSSIEVRAQRPGVGTVDLTIPVIEVGVGREHLNALIASQRVETIDGVSIAFAHLSAGVHPAIEEEFRRFVTEDAASADAFILDLRSGYGGAHPGYLAPFFEAGDAPAAFDGPLVALIDESTRSGKEWLAWEIAHRKRGTLVGSTTAGAFVGGRFQEIVRERVWLYLAVVAGPEGIELEGIGQPADRPVVRNPFVPADDLPMQRAIETAIAQVRESSSP